MIALRRTVMEAWVFPELTHLFWGILTSQSSLRLLGKAFPRVPVPTPAKGARPETQIPDASQERRTHNGTYTRWDPGRVPCYQNSTRPKITVHYTPPFVVRRPREPRESNSTRLPASIPAFISRTLKPADGVTLSCSNRSGSSLNHSQLPL